MKSEVIRFRCSNAFKEKAEAEARKENRTLSNYIECVLLQRWAMEEGEKGTMNKELYRKEIEERTPGAVPMYAVIDHQRDGEGDEYVTLCDTYSSALNEAKDQLQHMTASEKKKRSIEVAVISAKKDEDGNWQPWAENEDTGLIDADLYDAEEISDER